MNYCQFKYFLLTILFCFLSAVSHLLSAQSPDLTWMERMPVIEISYDNAQFNTETFVDASFVYYATDTICQYSCKVRHRGGTSTAFAKPSYAVKFYDEGGASLDVSFAGMRTDNYWILDAAAGDHSKIRNRASMDLWLDFSHKPYHQAAEKKAINGTRGRFVEVYANGNYAGVYCLSERVDRKQLKLKKFSTNEETGEKSYRGLLYKAVNNINTRTPFFYYNKDVPSSDAISQWDGMKNEYPDVLDAEPWSWTPLLTSVKKVALNSSSFRTNVETYFDLPVFFDYVLYIDLMCALDNVGKNFYCWFYDYSSGDKRLGYTPWDMDATWGRNWTGDPMSAEHPMNNRSNFHYRMKESYSGYLDTLAIRYAELRRTFWAEESLYRYFDRYFQLFEGTGAIDRELQRWSGSNCRINTIEVEKEFIHQWIHDRLVFLDEEYGFDPNFVPEDPDGNDPIDNPDDGSDPDPDNADDPETPDYIQAVSPDRESVIRHNLWGRRVEGSESGWLVRSGRLVFVK